jgi:undecaprenyl-diphosphatase
MRNLWQSLLWQWHYWDAALSHLLAMTPGAVKPDSLRRLVATVGAHLGDSWLWALMTLLLWRWWRSSPRGPARPLWGWAVSLLGGAMLTLAVKRRIRRRRPQVSPLLHGLPLHGPGADEYSFPSGHAVRWGVIAAWSSRFVPYGTLLAWPLALWTGWSRVHLGIHYVGDVVAGYAVGALVGWLVRRLFGEGKKSHAAEHR